MSIPRTTFNQQTKTFALADGTSLTESEVRQGYNLWLLENVEDQEELQSRQWKNLTISQREDLAGEYDDMRDYVMSHK